MIFQFSMAEFNKIKPNYPQNWKLLNNADLKSYFDLQYQFQQETAKSPKGKRLDSFTEKLNKIKKFIEKGDGEDWKRSIVCGIFFSELPNFLAIQIQQFKMLVGKCKSSINGSFQQLGYVAQPQLEQEFLSKKIPIQFRKVTDFKKWSIRQKINDYNMNYNSNSWKAKRLIKVEENPMVNSINSSIKNAISYSNLNIESNLVEQIEQINEKKNSNLFIIELPTSCFYGAK